MSIRKEVAGGIFSESDFCSAARPGTRGCIETLLSLGCALYAGCRLVGMRVGYFALGVWRASGILIFGCGIGG